MSKFDLRYGFPKKSQLLATDKFVVQDKDFTLWTLDAAAFANLPERSTPQTGDAILAVDADGNLFRIEGFSGTFVVEGRSMTFVNGILTETSV
jgi:hypothetical protein